MKKGIIATILLGTCCLAFTTNLYAKPHHRSHHRVRHTSHVRSAHHGRKAVRHKVYHEPTKTPSVNIPPSIP